MYVQLEKKTKDRSSTRKVRVLAWLPRMRQDILVHHNLGKVLPHLLPPDFHFSLSWDTRTEDLFKASLTPVSCTSQRLLGLENQLCTALPTLCSLNPCQELAVIHRASMDIMGIDNCHKSGLLFGGTVYCIPLGKSKTKQNKNKTTLSFPREPQKVLHF